MNFGAYFRSFVKNDGVRINLNNNIEMNPASTRYLVADYLSYRLQKHEYVWSNRPPLQNGVNKIHHSMRKLADDFEERYASEFEDMVQQLNISPDIAYPTFIAVANELFVDGINWGRVVALFAFGGAIALECCQKHMSHLVDSIYDWVSTYVQNQLDQWITSQGGWKSFVEFYENRPAEKAEDNPWPAVGHVVLGVGAILAIGAFLTKS